MTLDTNLLAAYASVTVPWARGRRSAARALALAPTKGEAALWALVATTHPAAKKIFSD